MPQVLAVGTLLDRFGAETGTFFSPKGESFRSRSLPYVCARLEYRVYRIEKPLEARTCKAIPWFGEPGGAATIKTSRSAASLVADGTLAVVSQSPPGDDRHPPQCD